MTTVIKLGLITIMMPIMGLKKWIKMKTLFLLVLVPITLLANTMECKSTLTLFDKSLKQNKPISDGLLMMTIVYCEDLPEYNQILTQMMNILDSTEN